MVADCRTETGSSQQTSTNAQSAPIAASLEALWSRGRWWLLLVLALCSGVVLGRLWALPEALPVSAVPDQTEPNSAREQQRQLALLPVGIGPLAKQAQALDGLTEWPAAEFIDRTFNASLAQMPFNSVAWPLWQRLAPSAQVFERSAFGGAVPAVGDALSLKFWSAAFELGAGTGFGAYEQLAPTVIRIPNVAADDGHAIEIRHIDSHITPYAHHQRYWVDIGYPVEKGQGSAIARRSAGSTGEQVHFDLPPNAQAVDPRRYIARIETEP